MRWLLTISFALFSVTITVAMLPPRFGDHTPLLEIIFSQDVILILVVAMFAAFVGILTSKFVEIFFTEVLDKPAEHGSDDSTWTILSVIITVGTGIASTLKLDLLLSF